MTDLLWVLVRCLGMILLGILAGNGAVYFFNHMPAKWLCDYGEEPSEELADPLIQRVKSYPWKWIFTMLFILLGIKMVMDDWQYALAALCTLWLLLEMAIADVRCRIVPDQLILLLAVTAIGFIPFHFDWLSPFFGLLAGFGIMGFTGLCGRLMHRRETIGGGDIKLFSALGLVMGLKGILFVFCLTAFLGAGHAVFLLAGKKLRLKDSLPMVPYIAIASGIYLVFLWHKLPL